jgi:hypothetical protein
LCGFFDVALLLLLMSAAGVVALRCFTRAVAVKRIGAQFVGAWVVGEAAVAVRAPEVDAAKAMGIGHPPSVFEFVVEHSDAPVGIWVLAVVPGSVVLLAPLPGHLDPHRAGPPDLP